MAAQVRPEKIFRLLSDSYQRFPDKKTPESQESGSGVSGHRKLFIALEAASTEFPLLVTDGTVGAGRDANPVQVAFIFVDDRSAGNDADRLFRTDFDTFATGAAFILIDDNLHGRCKLLGC